MMNTNTQKYLSFIVVIIVIAGGIFLLKSKKVDAPTDVVEVPDNTTVVAPVDNIPSKPTTGGTVVKPIPKPTVVLTEAQKILLVQLKKTADARDYEAFAAVLLEVYKNQWSKISDFEKTESVFYMYTYDTYFLKGDLANALKFSTIVYNKVPEAWRFRYIRVLTLEKYGRNALNALDLVNAEKYALAIMQMLFRPEGANLMADIYISKINTNIKDGNTDLAKQNLKFVWDYEVSVDRRATLTNLKTQLGL